jgi:ribosomal protein S18 acetylase RimI-like enzyme
LQDLSDPSLSDAIERNQWEFIQAFNGVGGVEVEAGAATLRVWTRVPAPLFNAVLWVDAPEERLDDAIDDAAAWFGARGGPWSWYAGPASRPESLIPALERRGFVRATDPPGMAAALEGLPELKTGAGVSVERVTDRRTLKAWFDVFSPSFDLSRAAGRAFHDLLIAAGFGDDAPMHHLVAWEGREAVATASVVPAAGVGGIYNVATRRDRRGRGIGGAVTLGAMHEIAELGFTTAVLWSTPAGMPVYRRLGFVEKLRVPTYLAPGK